MCGRKLAHVRRRADAFFDAPAAPRLSGSHPGNGDTEGGEKEMETHWIVVLVSHLATLLTG